MKKKEVKQMLTFEILLFYRGENSLYVWKFHFFICQENLQEILCYLVNIVTSLYTTPVPTRFQDNTIISDSCKVNKYCI